MISRLVLILYDNTWDIEDIKNDIKEERFTHHFIFTLGDIKLTDIDEVWTFGDVSDNEIYKLAYANKVDIWEMA